jgi:polyhydroxyalkanoate synthesis regulator phasin
MAENDLLKRFLDAGMTFTALTRQRAEELVRDLVRAGAVQAEQAQTAVEELLERSRHNRDRLIETVRSEIDQQISRLDLATREDIERMFQRVVDSARALVGQATGRGAEPKPEAPAAVTEAPAGKAAARKTTAKRTAKKTSTAKAAAKKAPARKAPAKKAAAKKTSTRKATTRSSTRKTAGGGPSSAGGASSG